METVNCSQCGASNRAGATKCWLCLRTHGPDRADAVAATAPHAPAAHGTFGLDSLMLVIALVAVCLGVTREAPGLGIGMVIVMTPALIRTFGIVARKKATGKAVATAEKIGVFLSSFGVVTTVGVAASVAFCAMCAAGFFGGAAIGSQFERGEYAGLSTGLIAGVTLGIVAALLVAFLLFRRLWPHKS